jgi:ATP-dependent exoDNAse (exonuclease V) beta subunit
MPSILDPDTELRFPSYTIVSASAGSGKTHALVHRFIQLLLSDRIRHNSLRNILAITFTNNAASEMRNRVVDYLKAISLGDEQKITDALQLVSMERGRLQLKSRVVLEHMLANYADLQIKTIDSFLTSVFKTSSFEFGFQPDVEILLDNRQVLDEAFGLLTRELKDNEPLRHTLEELVEIIRETRMADRFLWDPYRRIVGEVRRLYSRLASQVKPVLPGDGIEVAEEIKKQLREQAERIRGAVERSGQRMDRRLADDLAMINVGRIDTVLGRERKSTVLVTPKGGVGRSKYEQWEPLLRAELESYNTILDQYVLWQSRNYYKAYIDAVDLVRQTLDRLKRQRGLMLIDDVSRLLIDYLRGDTVADAYLMLGEQIYHFLIDEFQDTSPIQWVNLKPLIENSLSQGGSLFVVGDTKQSIYAFRNADWRIMKRVREGNEFPAAIRRDLSLETNRRSGEEIIKYVAEVFESNVANSEYADAGRKSGLNKVQQVPMPEQRGKGTVEVWIRPWDEETRPERGEILQIVQDCHKRGYRYRDIAILTPQNERVLEVSGWLSQMGIPVLPFSSLDIRTRKIINEVLALLKFLDSPVDDLSFGSFLLGQVFQEILMTTDPHPTPDDLRHVFQSAARHSPYPTPAYKEFIAMYPDFWDVYFDELFRLVGYLPLYDLVSEAYKTFHVFENLPGEEASLVKLLEVLKDFERREGNSLKNFLDFSAEDGDISMWQVQVPMDVDAVRVLTIHKAKGLEFNVVIVLFYDRDRWQVNYFIEEEDDGVRLLRIRKDDAERISQLAEVYARRILDDQVDELNKLYVSLTRAKHELYVLGLEGQRDNIPSRFLDRREKQLSLRGPAVVKPEETGRLLLPLHHSGRPVLPDAATGVVAFKEIRRGECIHEILSQIEFLDSRVDSSLDALIQNVDANLYLFLDLQEVKSTLLKFLSLSEIARFFIPAEKRLVYREKEFCSDTGMLYRMDRVVVDPEEVAVIDFKTGDRRAEADYLGQVRAYMGLLYGIYPGRSVNGWLAYIDECLLVKVE